MVTFNVLIASIGRKSLLHILNSLKPQLTNDDCITIVFDGRKPDFYIDTSEFLCPVFRYYEQQKLGYFGHAVRNKYASLLEKRDFILHADDDDIYLPDAFNSLRKECYDVTTLYIAKMSVKPWTHTVIPAFNILRVNNVGTPNGVIPYELNKLSWWASERGGDGCFYEELNNLTDKIIFLDTIIYQVNPSQILDYMWNNYNLACYSYVPIYTGLFQEMRFDVKNLLQIGGDINRLSCWCEYFINGSALHVLKSGSLSDISSSLDIVIDSDGLGDSFVTLYKQLSKNGFYIIENVRHNSVLDLNVFPDYLKEEIRNRFTVESFDNGTMIVFRRNPF